MPFNVCDDERPCSTHQWFLTALSVRPGRSFAIAAHATEKKSGELTWFLTWAVLLSAMLSSRELTSPFVTMYLMALQHDMIV
jgi:hypothetical protein